ncbi:YetF domain-containing protein [Ethanoligenens harbinense]|uniref:YetF C-terminal domain-containing protein n=1 Tax=Ethanoligenens harbinense (strain DSM 18485 / JCM 12961 / CGMCC 1.5033 / YUAN-3) TaxID=663278 RepID=E6U961_ETHHY|nr:DUF421 domain-containing protein [Ethanoligenens harbinense]ADU27220.1 protein of unknown function DUF421 [Ethanoligenens harbinense YUAN-3]
MYCDFNAELKIGAIMTWNGFLFGAKELPLWVFPIRAIILYAFLILATRLMRQRQIAILAGHNYLVAAGIVSLAAVRMVNPESSLVSGIVIILIYAAVNVLLSYLDVKFPRKVGRHSTILIENGRLIKKNLLDARITIDNLLGQLRIKNIFNFSEIDTAIVEPTGKINVIKKPQFLPITRKQMNLPFKNTGIPVILIYDGEIQNDSLQTIGQDFSWLDKKLKEKGVIKVNDVFLAAYESDGTVYISV